MTLTTLDIFYDYTCEDSYPLSVRLLRNRGPLWAAGHELEIRWRSFPLEWVNGETHHVPAMLAFRSARAALLQGREAFYRFHPRLFDTFHAEGRDISIPEVVLGVAEAAELDMDRFKADAGLAPGGRTATIDVAIREDYQLGIDNFVFGTPTVIVNDDGRIFNPGVLRPHLAVVQVLIG